MTPMQNLNHKYGHALLSFFEVFKAGEKRKDLLEAKVTFLTEEIFYQMIFPGSRG